MPAQQNRSIPKHGKFRRRHRAASALAPQALGLPQASTTLSTPHRTPPPPPPPAQPPPPPPLEAGSSLWHS